MPSGPQVFFIDKVLTINSVSLVDSGLFRLYSELSLCPALSSQKSYLLNSCSLGLPSLTSVLLNSLGPKTVSFPYAVAWKH